jgi:hypothetical protein
MYMPAEKKKTKKKHAGCVVSSEVRQLWTSSGQVVASVWLLA